MTRIQYEVQQTIYTDRLDKWRPAFYAEDGGVETTPSLEIAADVVVGLIRAGAVRERLRIIKRTIIEEVAEMPQWLSEFDLSRPHASANLKPPA